MDALATTLLRRLGRVPVPAAHAGGNGSRDAGDHDATSGSWVRALEADLARRGWVLHADLRAAAARLPQDVRLTWADWLIAAIDDLTGADRDLTPLFRRFPDTPGDAFVDRLLTHLFATEGAPCVLCGRDDVGHPLDPCGHLVCRDCFPPTAYSGCPICGRRLSATASYLPAAAPSDPVTPEADEPAAARAPRPVRLLRRDLDPVASATALRDELVARPGALSPADREDLHVTVRATDPTGLGWLPDTVPARETLAVLIAWALHVTALTDAQADVLAAATRHWRTATDIARTLMAYSGADPGLTDIDSRVRALPRPLRRAVLHRLDAMGPATAAEDLSRHPVAWKRIAERLHPFERVAATPAAAVAFAALRGTRTPVASPLGAAIIAAAEQHPRRLTALHENPQFPDGVGGVVPASGAPHGTVSMRVRTHASEVEAALAGPDPATAVDLLAERPGDFWRRLDHLLRTAGDDDAVIAAAAATAGRVAPALLATVAATLAGRDATVPAAVPAAAGEVGRASLKAAGDTLIVTKASQGGPPPGTPRRLFFPSGGVVRTWTEPERRDRLPRPAIDAIRGMVDDELTRRAARHTRFEVAVIDATLAEVPAPMRERAASRQLAAWPRGSRRDLPSGDKLRLFLHWEDAADQRVDLDLSCMFVDENWVKVGHCDYTRLTFGDGAAVHSGDFTSAPPPSGATEFLDLDLPALVAAGARWAVPVVFSYNDVPFERMTEAFAGFLLPAAAGPVFDASRVAQRFDLTGAAKALMPMVVDLAEKRLLWTDLALGVGGGNHRVDSSARRLARSAADHWEYFAARPRPTVFDVARWHATGRAEHMIVVDADGPDVPDLTGRTVFAAVTDADMLAGFVPGRPADGSLALTVTGRPDDPWRATGPAELLSDLTA